MLFYNQTKKYHKDQNNLLADCMEFVENSLSVIGTDRKIMLKTLINTID